ncbi:MAG: OadG-related small transporter subunit [Sphaerochaeta sp.]|jgi:Na+-transporting methylmalonyl-CoA/oxaloacetate decarboxylase gamma subunit
MDMSAFNTSLVLMGKGMAAIFVVIFIIYIVILALGKRK